MYQLKVTWELFELSLELGVLFVSEHSDFRTIDFIPQTKSFKLR